MPTSDTSIITAIVITVVTTISGFVSWLFKRTWDSTMRRISSLEVNSTSYVKRDEFNETIKALRADLAASTLRLEDSTTKGLDKISDKLDRYLLRELNGK